MSKVHPWEQAWRKGRWKEASLPLPAVEEFCEYLAQMKLNRVLDLGAGSGRHALLMARKGFQVVAADVSETALSVLDRRVKKGKFRNVVLVNLDMSCHPFRDGYFDGVISTDVMHHGLAREVKVAFREVHRVTKSGGAGLFVELSDKDFRFGTGKRLEPKTYVFTHGEESGIVHHFFGLNEFRSVLKSFRIVKLWEELFPEKEQRRAHIYTVVKKP